MQQNDIRDTQRLADKLYDNIQKLYGAPMAQSDAEYFSNIYSRLNAMRDELSQIKADIDKRLSENRVLRHTGRTQRRRFKRNF